MPPPLNIAFFGTDLFSIYSLKALHANRSLCNIQTLHLITRPPKPTGRGRSIVRDAASAEWAASHDIPIRRAETKQDIIDLNSGSSPLYNIAVAVSYGQLIPAQFLRSLAYPGLNVHPSLLPDLRGSSPLQYSLLEKRTFTGVSVQTLHPTKFDHGNTLFQSPEIPIFPDQTVDSLRDKLGPIGAQGLVEVLLKGLFLDPQANSVAAKYPPSYAPKISKQMSMFDPSISSVDDTLVKFKVFGSVYSFQACQPKRRKVAIKKRVIFHDLKGISSADKHFDLPTGGYKLFEGRIVVRLSDGYVQSTQIQFEGEKVESAEKFMSSVSSRGIKDQILFATQS